MTTLSAKGTRLNRRGQATRTALLGVAIRCLAEGGPDAVSANRVAREAGVTWGALQHQFGDSDGLWAAVLTSIAGRGPDLIPLPAGDPSPTQRVAAIVDLVWDSLERPSLRAVRTLREGLPRERADLQQQYPLTAAAMLSWEEKWVRACVRAFDGLEVDPERLRRFILFLPGAVSGLHAERQLLADQDDVADARRGLADAIIAYLV